MQANLPRRGKINPVLVEMNKANEAFWKEYGRDTERRSSDPMLLGQATEDLLEEEQRGTPVYHRHGIEFFLQRAEQRRKDILRLAPAQRCSGAHGMLPVAEAGALGGKAVKTDALQALILQMVRDNPAVTWKQLDRRLRSLVGQGTIVSADDNCIVFLDGRGREKKAPVSGLPHRVSRARNRCRAFPCPDPSAEPLALFPAVAGS